MDGRGRESAAPHTSALAGDGPAVISRPAGGARDIRFLTVNAAVLVWARCSIPESGNRLTYSPLVRGRSELKAAGGVPGSLVGT
jgi:hypothetical protein